MERETGFEPATFSLGSLTTGGAVSRFLARTGMSCGERGRPRGGSRSLQPKPGQRADQIGPRYHRRGERARCRLPTRGRTHARHRSPKLPKMPSVPSVPSASDETG